MIDACLSERALGDFKSRTQGCRAAEERAVDSVFSSTFLVMIPVSSREFIPRCRMEGSPNMET